MTLRRYTELLFCLVILLLLPLLFFYGFLSFLSSRCDVFIATNGLHMLNTFLRYLSFSSQLLFDFNECVP